MDAGHPALRERLTGLRLQRDELAREVSEQQKRLAAGTPMLTPEKMTGTNDHLPTFSGVRSQDKTGCYGSGDASRS